MAQLSDDRWTRYILAATEHALDRSQLMRLELNTMSESDTQQAPSSPFRFSGFDFSLSKQQEYTHRIKVIVQSNVNNSRNLAHSEICEGMWLVSTEQEVDDVRKQLLRNVADRDETMHLVTSPETEVFIPGWRLIGVQLRVERLTDQHCKHCGLLPAEEGGHYSDCATLTEEAETQPAPADCAPE